MAFANKHRARPYRCRPSDRAIWSIVILEARIGLPIVLLASSVQAAEPAEDASRPMPAIVSTAVVKPARVVKMVQPGFLGIKAK
jgi:hypothetical protein